VAVVARPVAGSALAGSTNRATAVALALVLVRARRRARAGLHVAIAAILRLLMPLAVPRVDTGADALADSVVVPRRACRMRVDVRRGVLVVVIRADLVFAVLNDVGYALPQLHGIGTSSGSHGNGRSAADGQ